MHPGNRLPSVSMSIILMGFLFLVGYLNTDSKQTVARKELKSQAETAQLLVAQNKQTVKNNQLIAFAPVISSRQNKTSFSAHINITSKKNNTAVNRQTTFVAYQKNQRSNANSSLQTENESLVTTINTDANPASTMNNMGFAVFQNNNSATVNSKEMATGNVITAGNNELGHKEDIAKIQQPTIAAPVTNNNNTAETIISSLPGKQESITTAKANTETAAGKSVTSKSNNITALSQSEKAWIEDFAMHNKPAAKKWAGKLSLQAYITPSVVYRKLQNNAADKMLTGNTNSNYNNFNAEDAVTHKPSFGVETGLSLQYDVARKIKVKAGLQLNYTRYNAHAFETNHPIATSVTMNADNDMLTYEVFKTSNYSNAFGISPIKLHNETYQLSLPIGADFKLASLDNLSLYAGATLQPTVILYGKSYIISTDRRSYVQDPSLLNRFNLNAGFETYISYKTNSGYTWQLGPRYRTQIFSTNTKLYSVEERLQTFGFKIGVTKQL